MVHGNKLSLNFWTTENCQRGYTLERVISLIEQNLESDEKNGPELATIRPTENAGWVGGGSVNVSLANITTTDDMLGLRAGSS